MHLQLLQNMPKDLHNRLSNHLVLGAFHAPHGERPARLAKDLAAGLGQMLQQMLQSPAAVQPKRGSLQLWDPSSRNSPKTTLEWENDIRCIAIRALKVTCSVWEHVIIWLQCWNALWRMNLAFIRFFPGRQGAHNAHSEVSRTWPWKSQA